MTLAISKADLAAHDHFKSASSAPGRPRRYLEGGAGLLPHSCTLLVYKDVPDMLSFVARSLKTGSGVKTVFDRGFKLQEKADTGWLYVLLDPAHPDHAALSELVVNDDYYREHNKDRNTYVIDVQDSMETSKDEPGELGIIESWGVAYHKLLEGYDVVVNLSRLRRSGSSKDDGYHVTSSGPASFARIYLSMAKYAAKPTMLNLLKLCGTLNAVILKGGHKRGIVTSMMHTKCVLIREYLEAPTADLDGSHKKGVIIDQRCMTNPSPYGHWLRNTIIDKVNTESIFLQKCTSVLGTNYKDTYSNVCVGIMLPDRGTCLIWRVNLGRIKTRDELISAFELATRQVVSLHKEWHDSTPGNLKALWKTLEDDRQVAVDVVGLANMLKRFGVSYEQFLADLEDITEDEDKPTYDPNSLAGWFAEAYQRSAVVAQQLAVELGLPRFDRLHTVEPAQAHAFQLQDYEGATLTRGIWPPFAQVVTRMSDVEGSVTVDHGEVETLETVPASTVFALNSAWQRMMNVYGLPHAMSADIYEPVTLKWLDDWWESPQLTAYYQFASLVDQTFSRKVVEEVTIGDTDDFLGSFGRAARGGARDESPAKVCKLDPDALDSCSVCTE